MEKREQALCPVRSNGSILAWAADKFLIVYDLKNSLFVLNVDTATEGHSDTIRSISMSPDGATIATAGEDKRVIVWSNSGGEWTPSRVFAHKKKVMAVEITASGSVIFADKFGDFFRLRDTSGIAAGSKAAGSDSEDDVDGETELLFGHLAAVSTAIYSPARDMLVSADRDEKIRLTRFPKVWNIESFLFGHKRYVSSLAWFGADGLVSAGADGMIVLWDIENSQSPRQVWSICVGDGPVNSMAVADDKVLIIKADEPNKLVTIVNGEIVDTCTLPCEVQSVHVLPNARVALIDKSSHLMWFNGDRVPIAADVPGVPITLMKVVHHENFDQRQNDRNNSNKRAKREIDDN